MKIKDIFNIHNIGSFIEGNAKYFYDNLIGLPEHIKEQVIWRLSKCEDDCVKTGKCKVCGCPTHKKVFVTESCNNGERFPNMMNKEEWENYKKENNIE